MRIELPFLSGKVGTSYGTAGDEGHLVVDQLHGKYHQASKNARLFTMATTPLGLAIPLYTSVTPLGNALWNPAGSGYKATLVRYTCGFASGTTAVIAIGMMGRNGLGSVIASGSQITAFAETVPVSGQFSVVNAVGGSGAGVVSRMKSSNAGTCTISAGVAAEWLETMGGSGVAAQATALGFNRIACDFDGRWVIYPGTMIWFAATLASSALFAQSLSWLEEAI